MDNGVGIVSRFILENPPVGMASGAVGVAVLVAVFLRLFRNEVRSAALDKAAEAVLKNYQEDNKALRDQIKEIEKEKDELRKDLVQRQIDFSSKLSGLAVNYETAVAEKRRLEIELTTVKAELHEHQTETLKLEMQVSGQLSTIEDLSVKIRRLQDDLDRYMRDK